MADLTKEQRDEAMGAEWDRVQLQTTDGRLVTLRATDYGLRVSIPKDGKNPEWDLPELSSPFVARPPY